MGERPDDDSIKHNCCNSDKMEIALERALNL